MFKRLIPILILLLPVLCANAQEPSYTQTDTTVFGMVSDSLLTIVQSEAVADAMVKHVRKNERNKELGIDKQIFRIRIYFGNSRNARSEWEATAERFKERYPGVPVYKTFVSPNFKITVGLYYTRTEAETALARFKADYPAAFIVRE